MATEIELKLKPGKASPAELEGELSKLLKIKSFTRLSLQNIYYDTPELRLHREHVALRIRKNGKRYIQTLKTRGTSKNGLHQRGEWEWELESNALDTNRLSECEAWSDALELLTLQSVFETNFERVVTRLEWQGATIELALDQGEIRINSEVGPEGLMSPILEIELELLKGESSAILDLGKLLQNKLGLETYDESKAERGYTLYQSAKNGKHS